MIAPPLPSNEEERLARLHDLGLLDSVPEERFDRITRMATHMFGVNTALISLIDRNRQWFKSRQGLDVKETPRNVSFCGHAILGTDIFEVPNALKDERFRDNPMVTAEPHIRFYAGRPIRSKTGHTVGTLCLIHPQPRMLSENEKTILDDLASMVEDELNSQRLALLDELTGLTNRRGFLQIGNQLLALCRQNQKGIDLVYLDLDNFKPINDSFGHQAGDQVLKEFALALVRNVPESDVIGRIGGDEFAILCSGCENIETPLRRLRDNLDIKVGELRLGFSAGTVRHDGPGAGDIESLVRHADERMYAEKRGRARGEV